jgi:hypothetical protein
MVCGNGFGDGRDMFVEEDDIAPLVWGRENAMTGRVSMTARVAVCIVGVDVGVSLMAA